MKSKTNISIAVRQRRWWRSVASAAITLSLLVVGMGNALTWAQNAGEMIEQARTALEKWVETQRLISKERRDLTLAKEMLNERIALVQHEIDSLREKIKEAEQNIAQTEEKRAELMQQHQSFKQAASSLEQSVAQLERSLIKTLHQWPKPLQDRVKPLSRRLPENPEVTDLSLSERFQNLIGILNEANKFHGEITVTSEVRQLPDGQSAEVKALYFGLSHGYYVGANGRIAGVGKLGDEGWEWMPVNDAAGRIAQAMAIFNNESVAAFVQIPVDIR